MPGSDESVVPHRLTCAVPRRVPRPTPRPAPRRIRNPNPLLDCIESFCWECTEFVWGPDPPPYRYGEHMEKAEDAVEEGDPVDVFRRNDKACKTLYREARDCTKENIPCLKDYCDKAVKKYMVSCVETPPDQAEEDAAPVPLKLEDVKDVV